MSWRHGYYYNVCIISIHIRIVWYPWGSCQTLLCCSVAVAAQGKASALVDEDDVVVVSCYDHKYELSPISIWYQ